MTESQVTDDDVDEQVEMLTEQILAVLNGSPLETDRHVVVLVDALISVIGSIECRDCRRLTRRRIESLLPAAFDEAMRRPATDNHVH